MTTRQMSVRSESGLQSVIKSFTLIEALVEAGEASAATLAEEIGEPGARSTACWRHSSRSAVREILAEIRRTGVSISDGDVVAGVATVGAPVFDHRGVVRAAIAFNLLPEALRADRAGAIELARTASAAASRAFGYDLDQKGLPTTP